jgi:glycosyltransferase involved in cell wall biosynthesis
VQLKKCDNAKSMKTVLSFIDWYLPGCKAGGSLKAFANQVSHFNEDYRFKIITRDTDYRDAKPYVNVHSDEWNSIGNNTEAFYLSKRNINYGFLRNLVNNTEFDTVYIHGVYSFWFSILPIFLSKKTTTPKIVIATHGMFGKHAFSVKNGKKIAFVTAAKILGLYKNVLFHAANQDEADDIKNTIGAQAKIVIAEEMPMKIILGTWSGRTKVKGELTIASVARIAPEKNTLVAIEILEACTEGKITYDIYGPVYGDEYWSRCTTAISRLPKNITVNYMGSIPGDQVLDKLKTYHFLYLPTTGENFGHTILESFMASTPVIISNKTPWKNLEEKRVGWELPLEDKKAFAARLMKAADLKQEEYDGLSRKSLEYAQEFMKDKTVKEQNNKLFDDTL